MTYDNASSTKTGPNSPLSRWVILKPQSRHPKHSSHEFSHVFLATHPKTKSLPLKMGDPKMKGSGG